MPRRRPNAFTLLEILVVAILLAIVGALLVPRLAGKPTLTAQLAGEQVAELLSTFAFRASLSSQPVALMRHSEDGALAIWVLDTDPERPADPPEWRLDRFSRPLILPEGISVSMVRADTVQLVDDEWTIVATPGIARPRIELVLGNADTEVSVVLEPRASAPIISRVGDEAPAPRAPVDLDREGRAREIW